MGQPITLLTISRKYDIVFTKRKQRETVVCQVARESPPDGGGSRLTEPLKIRRSGTKKVSSNMENITRQRRQTYNHEYIVHSDISVSAMNIHNKTTIESPGTRKIPRKSKSVTTLSEVSPELYHEQLFQPIKYDDENNVIGDVSMQKRGSKHNVFNSDHVIGDAFMDKRGSKHSIFNVDRNRIPTINEPGMSSTESISSNSGTRTPRKSISRKLKDVSSTTTEDSGDVQDSKKDFLTTNTYTGTIVEFDRSDMSSDSEPESTRSTRRRMRTSTIRRSRSSLEDESRKNIENEPPPKDENNPCRPRRRRCGVSAEPVRVSWSTLRESLKLSQLDLTEGDPDVVPEETEPVNYDTTLNNARVSSDETLNQEITPDTPDNPDAPDIVVTPPNVDKEEEEVNPKIPIIEISKDTSTASDEPSSAIIPNDVSCKSEDVVTETDLPSTIKQDDITTETSDKSSPKSSPYETPEMSPTITPTPSPKQSLQVPTSNTSEIEKFPVHAKASCTTDLEKKYKTVVISFQTDQYTLPKRIENQERARDVAESGMDKELCKLTSTIQELRTLQNIAEYEETWYSLQKQVDILRKAAIKVSSQSEQHGCYQQEKRSSPSIDIVIAYAENLRATVNKLEEELGRAKRNLQNINISPTAVDNHQRNGSIPTDTRSRSFTDYEPYGNPDTKDRLLQEKIRRQSMKDISNALMAQKGNNNNKVYRGKNIGLPSKKDLMRVSFSEEVSTDETCKRSDSVKRNSKSKFNTMSFFDSLNNMTLYFVIFSIISVVSFFLGSCLGIDTKRLHDKIIEYIPYNIAYESNDEKR